MFGCRVLILMALPYAQCAVHHGPDISMRHFTVFSVFSWVCFSVYSAVSPIGVLQFFLPFPEVFSVVSRRSSQSILWFYVRVLLCSALLTDQRGIREGFFCLKRGAQGVRSTKGWRTNCMLLNPVWHAVFPLMSCALLSSNSTGNYVRGSTVKIPHTKLEEKKQWHTWTGAMSIYDLWDISGDILVGPDDCTVTDPRKKKPHLLDKSSFIAVMLFYGVL